LETRWRRRRVLVSKTGLFDKFPLSALSGSTFWAYALLSYISRCQPIRLLDLSFIHLQVLHPRIGSFAPADHKNIYPDGIRSRPRLQKPWFCPVVRRISQAYQHFICVAAGRSSINFRLSCK
jgi:hypothetical protein